MRLMSRGVLASNASHRVITYLLLVDLLNQPTETVLETIAVEGGAGLDLPLAIADEVELELTGNL